MVSHESRRLTLNFRLHVVRFKNICLLLLAFLIWIRSAISRKVVTEQSGNTSAKGLLEIINRLTTMDLTKHNFAKYRFYVQKCIFNLPASALH